jgi:hypothetical protein
MPRDAVTEGADSNPGADVRFALSNARKQTGSLQPDPVVSRMSASAHRRWQADRRQSTDCVEKVGYGRSEERMIRGGARRWQ